MSTAIEVSLPYVRPMNQEPISHAGYPELENLVYDWRPMKVRNAREIPGGASLKTHGFCTVPHAPRNTRFDGSNDWMAEFVEEVESLLKQITGAAEIIIPHGVASYRSAAFTGSLGPASFTHNDFTAVGTAQHVANLDPAKAEARLAKRYGAYHAWHLASPPPQDIPLALCDARSVRAADVIAGKAYYGGPDNTTLFGNMAMFRYNPAHEWFYYPDLRNDETLIWCGYDSDPAYASIVPHTAFRDPTSPANAVPRANVECRCFLLFD